MGIEKTIADRYINRDGSPVTGGPQTSKTLTRIAVAAAQAEMARHTAAGRSPISDKQMHAVLLAAIKASPELFNAM